MERFSFLQPNLLNSTFLKELLKLNVAFYSQIIIICCFFDFAVGAKWKLTPSKQQPFLRKQPTDCVSKIRRGRLKHPTSNETQNQTETRATPVHSELGWRKKEDENKLGRAWNQSSPHFFSLASQVPVTELPVHHRDQQQAENEWDANLSWHVKLCLDQITKRSSVNGRAWAFVFQHWRLKQI